MVTSSSNGHLCHLVQLQQTCAWSKLSITPPRPVGESLAIQSERNLLCDGISYYHELMSVNHVFREIAGVPLHNTELTVNYTFHSKQTQENEVKVRKMMAYVLKYENPFKIEDSTELTLHNFLTSAIMLDTVLTGLLSLKDSGAKLYSTFRKERFVDRSKRLSDVIPRTNLKTFSSIEGKKKVSSKIPNKQDKKYIGSGQKKLDIERVRGSRST